VRAAGAPADPEFHYYDQYPLTSSDPGVRDTVTEAFVEHFGPRAVYEASRVTASEDFSLIPDAFGVPYTYWTVGWVDPARYREAVARGAVGREIPANHSRTSHRWRSRPCSRRRAPKWWRRWFTWAPSAGRYRERRRRELQLR